MSQRTREPQEVVSARGFLNQMRLGQQLGLTRQTIEDTEFRGDTITLRGRELVNFGLCSYLGLGDDSRLVEAGIDAIRRYGNSYSSSMSYTSLPLYVDLRERLSAMLDAPVLVAASTSQAHMAALPTIVQRGDVVLVDTLAHASIQAVIPSLKAGGASVFRVPHHGLEKVGEHAEKASQKVWYLIDGIYSMHGDTAPAEDIRALMDTYESLWVYSDDAHGFGWSGDRGRGQYLDRSGWHERLVMSFGLAKSFGTIGGVVAAQDDDLTDMIQTVGGPMVFGGPLPPSSLAAGVASADIHLSDELPVLQAELIERIDLVNTYAAEIGLPLSATDQTPLWFIRIGQSMTTVSVAGRMARDGFFVNPAVFPVVKKDAAGIRFTVTRYNAPSQIRAMLEALNAARLHYIDDDDVVDLTVFEHL